MVECFLEAQKTYRVPAVLLVAVAYVESGLHPYAVNLRTRFRIDNLLEGVRYRRSKHGKGYTYSVYPGSLEEGLRVLEIARVFGDYDVGVMQINRRNAELLKKKGIIRREEDLFDPCFSIKAGAYLLSLCVERYGLTSKAVDCYNKGAGKAKEDSSYVRKVSYILGLLLSSEE